MTEPTEPAADPRGGIPGWQAAMRLSRRVRALLVGAVLFALALTLHVPYVILSPGPTCNVLGNACNGQSYDTDIVNILGGEAKSTSGNLNLTTVNVTTHTITPFEALVGWLKSDQVVVPEASVYPPGQSHEQVDEQNTADFKQSQDSAITAAACELGYPKGFGILSVAKDDPKTTDRNEGPSEGKLHPGDLFESIAGVSTTTLDALTGELDTLQPGATVPVVVKRSGSDVTVDVTLGAPVAGRKGGSLGVVLNSDPDACLFPFEIDLGLGDQIGGPSAGTMFALGIIDKVGKQDLTHGRFIAGTGTIDAKGNVGPIGGIQLKMIAARRAGATIFLAPQGNCQDVRGNIPSGLTVVKVDTLHHAIQYLDDLQNGRPVPGC